MSGGHQRDWLADLLFSFNVGRVFGQKGPVLVPSDGWRWQGLVGNFALQLQVGSSQHFLTARGFQLSFGNWKKRVNC